MKTFTVALALFASVANSNQLPKEGSSDALKAESEAESNLSAYGYVPRYNPYGAPPRGAPRGVPR